MLKPGAIVLDFKAIDHEGKSQRLSDIVSRGPAVFFFYPKDFTAICTKEACGFRDAFEELSREGAQLYGVSVDDVETHKRFREKYALQYSLLSDPTREIAEIFDVVWALGFLNRRATFVVDKDRRVQSAFQHELSADKHVADVRATLARLKG